MKKTFTYKFVHTAKAAIRAVIASTCIVFIENGEAITFPDNRG